MNRILSLYLVLIASFVFFSVSDNSDRTYAQDQLFSGPQVGEKFGPFNVRGVFDDDAGKLLDFVSAARVKPIVLIFVHDVNRQSVSMTRILSGYTSSRLQDGLSTGVVWLDDDATAAEEQLKKIRHALAANVPTGVSVDGREGPGSYGLNRNVTLTILIGNDGRITGNFALVQPSLEVDLPKILQSIVEVVGGEVPQLSELPGMPEMKRAPPAPSNANNLRPLLAPLIRANATEADVDKAAKAVEARVAEDDAVRAEIGRIAATIVDSGKLQNYGTAKAQRYLERWAKEFKQQSPEVSQTGSSQGVTGGPKKESR